MSADFEGLASSSLPSLNVGGNSTPSLNRSLKELMIESDSVARNMLPATPIGDRQGFGGLAARLAAEKTRERPEKIRAQTIQQDPVQTRALLLRETCGARTSGGSVASTNTGSKTPMPSEAIGYPDNGPTISKGMIRSYLAAIQKWNKHSDTWVAVKEIEALVDSADSRQDAGYKSTLLLVQHVISRPNTSPMQIAIATLKFLSLQFQNVIFQQV